MNAAERRERYLHLLAHGTDLPQAFDADPLATAQVLIRFAVAVGDTGPDRTVDALALVHRALAAQCLDAGLDPSAVLDELLADDTAHAGPHTDPPPSDDRAPNLGPHRLAAALDALDHACRFARDGRHPAVLRAWTQLAASHLFASAADVSAPPRVR